jgi:hypothetical protein
MTLAEALRDPNLFAKFFRGKSWDVWKVFLAALFAEAPSDDDLSLFQAFTGRTTWPTSVSNEAALIVGRRGGKSRTLALIAVYLATMKDYTPYLAPGEVATIAILAADRSQARVIFRFVIGLLKAVRLLEPLIERNDTEQIVLRNRVVIEISTASFRSTRGYSFAAVLCDEVAFWRSDETSANPDIEILRALRPGLASIPGSMLLIASSPYAKRGELYSAFRRHYGQDDARVLVWKATTAHMNPQIDPAIIAEAYETDPEAARAEYGAEFRDDLADYITREAIDAITMWGRSELPPMPGTVYIAFCDPSGGVSDAMTLAIGHLNPSNMCVLDAVLEVRPPFDPEAAVAQRAALLRRYSIVTVYGDKYAGEWPPARFREHGIEFVQSAKPKSDIYHDFLSLITAHRIELLDISRISTQLCGLERRTARSGKDSIDHAPGGHDDLANAVAGVLVQLDLDRRPPMVRMEDVIPGPGDGPAGSGSATTEPDWFRYIYRVVIAVGADIAVVWCGVNQNDDGTPDHRLWIIDVLLTYLRPGLWVELGESFDNGARKPPLDWATLAPAPLAAQLVAIGHDVEALPEGFDAELQVPFATEVIGKGLVKFCAPVIAKMKTKVIGAALSLKSGDPVETALRAAFIAAIWTKYGVPIITP